MTDPSAAGMLPKRGLAEINENTSREVPRKKSRHDAQHEDPATGQENVILMENRERPRSPPLIPPPVPINHNDSSASTIPAHEAAFFPAECFTAKWYPFQPRPDTPRIGLFVDHPECSYVARLGHPHLLSMTGPNLPERSIFRVCDLVATVLWSFGDGQAWRMFDNPDRYQICAFRHQSRQIHEGAMRSWDDRGVFIGRKERKAYVRVWPRYMVGCYSYATGDTWDFETFFKFDIKTTGHWTPLATATAYKTNKNNPTIGVWDGEMKLDTRRRHFSSRDMARRILKYHWTTNADLAQVDFMAVEGAGRTITFKDLLRGMGPGKRPRQVFLSDKQRPRFVYLKRFSVRPDVRPSPFILIAGVEKQGATEFSFLRAPWDPESGRTDGNQNSTQTNTLPQQAENVPLPSSNEILAGAEEQRRPLQQQADIPLPSPDKILADADHQDRTKFVRRITGPRGPDTPRSSRYPQKSLAERIFAQKKRTLRLRGHYR